MDDVAGSAPRAAHCAAFYDSAAGFVGCVRRFVAQGLDAGEPVLIAAPAESAGLLRDHLDGDGGRVSWADMTAIGANPARIIPAIRAFAGAHDGGRVRCVAQCLWTGRTAAQRRETIRHEALVNLAFTDVPVSILCPYDVRLPEADIVASARLTHPTLIRDGRAQDSAAYDEGTIFPAGYDGALDPVPGDAVTLPYRDDLHEVREFISGHAAAAGLARHRIADLVIAVSELAANTYRHTAAGGTVRVWATADELICQVRDTGQLSEPLLGRVRRVPDGSGGQGLWLVHELCDLVEIRTGPAGTQVRVHMQLRPAAPAAASAPLTGSL
jgi:anti-sigma regulatory factor (Ser/Thr protein kinase)